MAIDSEEPESWQKSMLEISFSFVLRRQCQRDRSPNVLASFLWPLVYFALFSVFHNLVGRKNQVVSELTLERFWRQSMQDSYQGHSLCEMPQEEKCTKHGQVLLLILLPCPRQGQELRLFPEALSQKSKSGTETGCRVFICVYVCILWGEAGAHHLQWTPQRVYNFKRN